MAINFNQGWTAASLVPSLAGNSSTFKSGTIPSTLNSGAMNRLLQNILSGVGYQSDPAAAQAPGMSSNPMDVINRSFANNYLNWAQQNYSPFDEAGTQALNLANQNVQMANNGVFNPWGGAQSSMSPSIAQSLGGSNSFTPGASGWVSPIVKAAQNTNNGYAPLVQQLMSTGV